ncbi:MAG TPA: hypothetical protein PKA63_00170 [Oligoflexia bacterium]|nr:hypothetical protein [Oligoflexia bacterium]HMP47063.1 hypothetical protein [Oligoflexia bacterium]
MINKNDKSDKFNPWPYVVLGMLALTGVLNIILYKTSEMVNAPPLTQSPYNDSVKIDEVKQKYFCGKNTGVSFLIRLEESPLTLISELVLFTQNKLSGPVLVEAWNANGENFSFSADMNREREFRISVDAVSGKFTKGLWHIRYSGQGECEWIWEKSVTFL